MSRSWGRRAALALLVPITGASVLLATSVPAQAYGSGIGLASNAWLVTDLAAQAGNVAATAAQYDPVLEAEAVAARAATTTTTAAAGAKVKPKASGKLGLIVNTVAVLGALAFEFGGGSDEPALPTTVPAGTYTGYEGNPRCGWATPATRVTVTSCWSGQSTPQSTTYTGTFYGWNLAYVESWANTINTWSGGYVRVAAVATSANCPAESYFNNNWNGGRLTIPYNVQPTGSIQTFKLCVGDYGTGYEGPGTRGDIGRWTVPATSGQPLADPDASAPSTDPALVPRYIDSEITCKSAGGGTQVLTQRTGPFTVKPGQPNTLPDAPEMSCPAGTWLSQGKRELATEGSTEKVPLVQPYTSPPWVEQQVTDFPECFPAGNAKCVLELIRKATATAPELNCNSVAPVAGHACRDWMTDPNKANRYECRYGGTPVALRRCEPYAKAFTSTPQLTRTPDNPDAAPTPAPAPGTDPTPGETPDLSGCTPEWADLLSPWWVFKATSCALAWAFIPPAGYLDAKAGALRDEWAQTTPGLWLDKVGGLVTVPNGNCGGIPVDVDLAGGVDVDMNLGEACSGGVATAASMVKLAATAFICVGGAFAGLRILGAGIGWAPAVGKGADT